MLYILLSLADIIRRCSKIHTLTNTHVCKFLSSNTKLFNLCFHFNPHLIQTLCSQFYEFKLAKCIHLLTSLYLSTWYCKTIIWFAYNFKLVFSCVAFYQWKCLEYDDNRTENIEEMSILEISFWFLEDDSV